MSPRFRTRTVVGVCVSMLSAGVAAALIAGGGSAAASVASNPGVPASVMSVLNAHGVQFVSAPASATASISAGTAMDNAVGSAPWPGAATGASLVQTTALSQPQAPGSLVWLVNIAPNGPVYRIGGPASGGGTQPSSPPVAANYFVVVIDANDGHFIEAQDGYEPPTASTSSSARRRRSHVSRQGHITICGQSMPFAGGPKPTYFLSPRHTPHLKKPLRPGSFILIVSRTCSEGSHVMLQPRGVLAIVARAHARHDRGLVAIALHTRKVGKTLLTVRQDGRVIGRIRYEVTNDR